MSEPHAGVTEADVEALAQVIDPESYNHPGSRWHQVEARRIARRLLAPENHRALLDALTAAGALVEEGRQVLLCSEVPARSTVRTRLVTEWREVAPDTDG